MIKYDAIATRKRKKQGRQAGSGRFRARDKRVLGSSAGLTAAQDQKRRGVADERQKVIWIIKTRRQSVLIASQVDDITVFRRHTAPAGRHGMAWDCTVASLKYAQILPHDCTDVAVVT